MLLPSFDSFGQAVSEEIFFLEISQSEKRVACGGHVACLLTDRDEMSNLYRGTS